MVNNATMNVSEQVSLQDPAFNSFNFLRKCHNIFCSSCVILPSHQQCTGVPIPPHSCRRVVFLLFCLATGHLNECELISHCDFDAHFSNVEHLFMCLLAICVSSLKKCLFKSFAPK